MMWWRWFGSRKTRERDLERELRAHLELEAEEQSDANAARRALGNAARIKEQTREAWGWMWLERLWQDLRYAVRVLRKSPGFAAVAVFSLALGIGANTALFSVVDTVMLKSLPVREPRELREVSWLAADDERDKPPYHSYSGSTFHDSSGGPQGGTSFSYPAYQLLRDRVPQFSDSIGFAGAQLTLTARGASEVAIGWFVSGNYFSGLGVRPVIGRLIEAADDAQGAPAVAVLSYSYWAERFALDPKILGSQVSINQRTAAVVGIAAPGFEGLDPGSKTDVFVPMAQVPELAPSWYSLGEPFTWWVQVFARMRPGVTDVAAEGAAQAVLAAHIRDYAGQKFALPRVRLQAGGGGDGGLRDYAASRLYVLDAIVGAVLLIACVNLAHLLLARSAARRREIAIRLSIGSGRARLIRQLLTESLLLAGLGGAAGLAVAKALVDLLGRAVFGSSGVLIPPARVDAHALGFALAAALAAALLSGLLPAWRATRVDLGPELKGGPTALADSRHYMGRVLIAGQVALSLLLLVGAGLFVRTLIRLTRVDLGFNTGNLLVFQTDASRNSYKGLKLAEIYGKIRERIEAIPGVVSVGLSRNSLIGGQEYSDDLILPPRSPRPGGSLHVFFMPCSDSFLETVRIPLVLGRGFKDTDGPVAVVNEAFVKGYFLPGMNPIGQKINGEPVIEIVGVARDAHNSSVRASASPTIYYSYSQNPKELGGMSYAIRTAVPPMAVAGAVRKAVSEVDESIPVDRLRTMEEQIDLSLGSERTLAELVSAFGLAAVLLAAIGLYGVMAYTVARRTHEIGVRMALGANGRKVAWLVVRESVWMVAAGLAIGIPAALALSRFVSAMLFGVTPDDAWSFTAAALLMAAVGAAAAWIPARRASRVDPVTALRAD